MDYPLGSSMMSDYCKESPNILVLCSSLRFSGTYSNGTFQLPTSVKGCKKLSLLYACIPNTVYTFNGETFTWEETVGPVTLSFTLTGSFTATSLALYLQTQMIAASLATGNSYTYLVTHDTNIGKLTFAETSGPATFSILGSTAGFPIYKLGFNAADTTVATSVVTPNILNLQPPKGCVIELSGLSNAKKILHSSGGDLGHFFVPMTSDSFGIVDYFQRSSFANEVKLSKNEILSTFNYRLLDPETRLELAIQSNWMIVVLME